MKKPHSKEPRRNDNQFLQLNVERLEERRMLASIQAIAAGVTNSEILELEIDDQLVATFEDIGGDAYGGEFVTLQFNDPSITDIGKIRLNFTNDLLEGDVDRNVRVDAIIVDGVRFETESEDVFSDGSWRLSDGCSPGFKSSEFLHCNGYFEFVIGSALDPIQGIVGASTFKHFREQVEFSAPLENPVIITSVPTFNGRQSGVVGIDNVSDTGFDIRFREWDYLDGSHVLEDAEWLALEQGVFSTADGSIWEVGTVPGFGNNQFQRFNFEHDFDSPPIVFATVQTANSSPVTVRIHNVDATGFDVALFEEEAELLTSHPVETIGYLAIVPGAFSGIVTIGDQVLPYAFQEAQIGSALTPINSRVSLLAQEDQSLDTETAHVKELVDVMTLGSTVFAQDYALQGGDPFTFRSVRSATDATLPAGFEFVEILGQDAFQDAVALEIDDDGRMFVAEESGAVWVVEDGVKLATPFIDVSSLVTDDFADAGGFTAFALDPDFENNGYVYLMYTTESAGEQFGRLERYTQSTTNPDQADLSTKLILMGNNASDGMIKGDFHNVGDIEFGRDGSLMFSWGDTATNSETDPNQLRTQDVNLAAGKIFRINPANGNGYASNPFYTGDATEIASKVWAIGARNGFRFDVLPGSGSLNPAVGDPGTLLIADVGRNEFDELNVSNGGENFGWPYFEGFNRFREGGEDLELTFPAIAFPHPEARSIIGGAFYAGAEWPEEYVNQFFVSDFVEGWMRTFTLEADGSVTESDFGENIKGMTDMHFDTVTGDMYLVGRGRDIIFAEGEGLDGLYRISYVGP